MLAMVGPLLIARDEQAGLALAALLGAALGLALSAGWHRLARWRRMARWNPGEHDAPRWPCAYCAFRSPKALARCLLCSTPRVAQWDPLGGALPAPHSAVEAADAPREVLGSPEALRAIIEHRGLTASDCKTPPEVWQRATTAWLCSAAPPDHAVPQECPKRLAERAADLLSACQRTAADVRFEGECSVLRARIVERTEALREAQVALCGAPGCKTRRKVRDEARTALKLATTLFLQRNPTPERLRLALAHLEDVLQPAALLRLQLRGAAGRSAVKPAGLAPLALARALRASPHDAVLAGQLAAALDQALAGHARARDRVRELLGFRQRMEGEADMVAHGPSAARIDALMAEREALERGVREAENLLERLARVMPEDGSQLFAKMDTASARLEERRAARAQRGAARALAAERARIVDFASCHQPELLARREALAPSEHDWYTCLGLRAACGQVGLVRHGALWEGVKADDFETLRDLLPRLSDAPSLALVRDVEGHEWVLEALPRESRFRDVCEDTADVLAGPSHPSLVRVAGLFVEHGRACRALDAAGVALVRPWARTAGPEAVAQALAGVLMALGALHAAGRAHGQLGPRAVLVREDGAGLLMPPRPQEMRHALAASKFAPPEARAGGVAVRSPAADMYSFGVLLRELLPRGLQIGGRDALLARLLSTDPLERPSAAEALRAEPFAGPERFAGRK